MYFISIDSMLYNNKIRNVPKAMLIITLLIFTFTFSSYIAYFHGAMLKLNTSFGYEFHNH